LTDVVLAVALLLRTPKLGLSHLLPIQLFIRVALFQKQRQSHPIFVSIHVINQPSSPGSIMRKCDRKVESIIRNWGMEVELILPFILKWWQS